MDLFNFLPFVPDLVVRSIGESEIYSIQFNHPLAHFLISGPLRHACTADGHECDFLLFRNRPLASLNENVVWLLNP